MLHACRNSTRCDKLMSSQSTECKINQRNSIWETSERSERNSLYCGLLGIYIAIKGTLKQQEKDTVIAVLVGVGVEAQQRAEGKYIFIIESSTLQCVYTRNFAEGSSAPGVFYIAICIYIYAHTYIYIYKGGILSRT